jgi:hypothetical protein
LGTGLPTFNVFDDIKNSPAKRRTDDIKNKERREYPNRGGKYSVRKPPVKVPKKAAIPFIRFKVTRQRIRFSGVHTS